MTSVMYSDLGANESTETTRWLLVIKQRNLLNLFFFSLPLKMAMGLITLCLSFIVQSCMGQRRVYNGGKAEQASGRSPQLT